MSATSPAPHDPLDPDGELDRLLEAWQAGSEEAFAGLVERLERRVLTYLARLSPSADVEDLFQETFMRIHRARERIERGTRIAFYALRVARNVALSEGRREGARERALAGAADAAPSPGPVGRGHDRDRDLDPGRVAADADTRAAIGEALDQLPDVLRETVVLKIWSGMTWEEIGSLLGFSADTAARRFADALGRLSGTLGARLGEA